MRTTGSIALGIGLLLGSVARADNWPSFRGSDGSGIGTGNPPIQWDRATGANVRWEVALPGLGHASPIVWGSLVIVTTAVPSAGSPAVTTGWAGAAGESPADDGPWEWRVLGIDLATGRTLWSHAVHSGVPRSKRHVKATHANCTPATDGKTLVVHLGSEGLHALDLAGKPLWKHDPGTLRAGPAGYEQLEWGFASSPIIHDGRVIVQCDVQDASYWAAYDLADGREVLRVERGDDPTWATPTVYGRGAEALLICNGYKKMAAYALSTGERRWWLGGGGDVPVPRPLIAGDVVILTNNHSGKHTYGIRADARGDLTPHGDVLPDGLLWHEDRYGCYMPTPIVVDDGLYLADDRGILTRLEVRTGRRTYRERLPGGADSTYTASPVAAAGRLYTFSEAGQVDVIATGPTYRVLASNQIGGTVMASPALAGDTVIVRTLDSLVCFGSRSAVAP